MSLESILADAASRKILPTGMDTVGLRTLAADIRSRSLFSARTTSPKYLAKVAQVLDRLLGGEINQATAREELQDELDLLGYTPEDGFGDDPTIPPAEAGSLRDLSSDRRINLMLETQEALAYGKGQQLAGLTRVVEWPAWELVRIGQSAVPRDWAARWENMGGDLVGGGRMIAHKYNPIWKAIGDSRNFNDALDTDVPPFAFNSGMGWREVRADEAEQFGIDPYEYLPRPGKPLDYTYRYEQGSWNVYLGDEKIREFLTEEAARIYVESLNKNPDRPETPAPPIPRINDDLQASIDKIPPDLVAALRKDLPATIADNKAKYRQEMDAVREAYLAKQSGVTRKAIEQDLLKNRIRRVLGEMVIKNRISAFLNGREYTRHPAGSAMGGKFAPAHGTGAAGSAVRERRIRKAIREIREEIIRVLRQGGKYEGTIRVPGVGEVRLPFGAGGHWAPAPGDRDAKTHTDGWGLKKIREKHGVVAIRDIPEVLLRGKSTPWEQSEGYSKKSYTLERRRVVLSRKKGGPIVLTSFDPEANEIKKSDRKARYENRKPASPQQVNRSYEEDGNGDASPCPTHVGLVNSLPDAGASKTPNITPTLQEVKS